MSKVILFQGDSITDAGRSRDEDYHTGRGYATLVRCQLGADFPSEYKCINRGISGNRVVDIYARIKKDIINLKPDIMSIMVGVNDVWHELDCQNGVDCEKYKKIYRMLIDEVMEGLPDLKIMIMEPYLVKGAATEENWKYFRSEVEKRAEISRELAKTYGFTFVPLQQRFDEAVLNDGWNYWTSDGVHPTYEGHELIKREWIKNFKRLEGI